MHLKRRLVEVDTENQNIKKRLKADQHVKPISYIQSLTVQHLSNIPLPRVSISEIQMATNNWDKNQILGKGGFATVLKANWNNKTVAVKSLHLCKSMFRNATDEQIQREQWQQFQTELALLSSIIHKNIISLVAYSIDSRKLCLIYEYMPNRSLNQRLKQINGMPPLTWYQRFKIAEGITAGLEYLHNFRNQPIIHSDIKSANILLDRNLEPKIGDFGLAKNGIRKRFVKNSVVSGTNHYLPKEYLKNNLISTKLDVYCYGIVLYEMASGLKAFDPKRMHQLLRDYMNAFFENEVNCRLIDVSAGMDNDIVYDIFTILGQHCCKDQPQLRPDMENILKFIRCCKNVLLSKPDEIYVS